MIFMKKPTVTIVTAAYNSAEHIDQCIGSVINQTYRNWEMIIVIAPSTDDTLDIAEQYARRAPGKILVIPEQLKTSCSVARNRGISYATGEYIVILDSDDWLDPEKLEICVDALEANPTAHYARHKVLLHFPDRICTTDYNSSIIWGCGGMMFRTSLLMMMLKTYGYVFNVKMDRTDDADLMIRLRDCKFVDVNHVLSHYRWNPKGLTASTTPVQQNWIMVKMMIRNRQWKEIPEYTKNLALCIVNGIIGRDIVKWKKERFR